MTQGITTCATGLVLPVALWMCACGRTGQSPGPGTSAAPEGGEARAAVRRDNPCSLLHPAEVEKIVGMPVPMREIVDESTCHYEFAPQPESPGKAGANPPAAGDNPENAIKAMASAFADGPPRLAVKVDWDDGKTLLLATRAAGKLLDPGGETFERLAGIGDEAWLGPMASILVFSKGTTGVELDLRMVPDGKEKGIRLATLIASRL